MSRDGLLQQNQSTGETERVSKREQEADLLKAPEQQAAQDAASLTPLSDDATPKIRLPGLPGKTDTGTAERVLNRADAEHTRKATKKAARKAQQETNAKTRTSKLAFTDEERATPELDPYIQKSDKAAEKLDAVRAAIPKKKSLITERTFDEATGKAKVRLRFEETDKPPGGSKLKHNPLSRPAQEAGLFVHNKVHSVEKDNSGVEGAHKSEEAVERLGKYGARKVKQGYRSHKLKPYRSAAKAEKAADKANIKFLYHKSLQDNPQLTSNSVSRLWQKQRIKKQYAKEACNAAKGAAAPRL